MASTSSTVPAVEEAGAPVAQGGIDRDVNSILANLNQEQLASIVAAAVSNMRGRMLGSVGLPAVY